jgi:hypothetical protein
MAAAFVSVGSWYLLPQPLERMFLVLSSWAIPAGGSRMCLLLPPAKEAVSIWISRRELSTQSQLS